MPVDRFIRDERGAISPLMLVLLIGILLTTGISFDLLKHEGERADLQAALDRGVLAATSLNQRQDIETVIQSYVDNGVPFSDRVTLLIDADTTKNRREISAVATYDTDTIFLGLVGLGTMIVPARTEAVEGRENIEISLVLDRSGSMWPFRKIGTLRQAATEFVDIIEDNYGEGERATISLVPFAAGTAAGTDIFDFLQVERVNTRGSCLQFAQDAYTSTGLPSAGQMTQAPWWHREDCPAEDQAVSFISSDYIDLRSRVGKLQASGFTGTYIAMKWALAMLDPEVRTSRIYPPPGGGAPISFTDYLLDNGRMSFQSADRPVAWGDEETLKVIVVMTDGMINPPTDVGWRKNPQTAEGVRRFLALCELAEARDVLVFTIAFEAPNAAKDQMRTCATTPSNFFDVQGTDLVAAFEAIAQDITRLRLTE